MKKFLYFASLLVIFTTISPMCKDSKNPTDHKKIPKITNDFLVDSLATAETVALYKNLRNLAGNGVMFGHQDDLAYGVGWWAEPGRSDVKEVCGDYPAVYGWDLGDIQQTKNLDGVDFSQMKGWIRDVYERGGINTISMHLDNPVTKGDAWDNSAAVSFILPGKDHHADYLKTLDKIAAFLKDLKTTDGIYIPVIFRPYHEHNHPWPWWGEASCTVDEYNALWRMTVKYLRDDKGLHHLLYAISPQEISSENDYLERYPGDEWVDIFGCDYYALYDPSRVAQLGRTLQIITTLAEARGKVAALTEVGVEKLPLANWWTGCLLAAIKNNAQSKKIVWSLVWRNASQDHFFAPYPGQKSAADFVRFYQDPFTVFENDLSDMYH
jgi:mannan endo-1,4-beta-mannosidase